MLLSSQSIISHITVSSLIYYYTHQTSFYNLIFVPVFKSWNVHFHNLFSNPLEFLTFLKSHDSYTPYNLFVYNFIDLSDSISRLGCQKILLENVNPCLFCITFGADVALLARPILYSSILVEHYSSNNLTLAI